MNQKEILENNEKEILKQEDAEKYIQKYKEIMEQKRKKNGIRWFSRVAIVGILGILVCIRRDFNVYLACFTLVELEFLVLILQLLLKKGNQKLLNSIKPYGIRKLIFVERVEEKKSVLEYFVAENKEMKKIEEENILILDWLKEGEYATMIELGENNRFFSRDTDWAVW